MQGDKTEKQSVQNTTQNTSSTGQLTPFAPTQAQIAQLLSGVGGISATPNAATTGALDQITAAGQQGNAFAPQIGNVANTLLAGGGPDRTGIVNDAYSNLIKSLSPTASGDYLDPSKNPFFADTTAAIGNDVTNRIASIYAGAGRDPSGAGNLGYTLGKGIAEATAPVYANAYNTERANQLGAINNLFGAGTTAAGTLSGLDQTRLGNMQAGIGAADAANAANLWGPSTVLAAEAQRTGIPLDTLARQFGLVLPVAQAFGTQSQSGTQTGTGTTNETSVTRKDPLSQIIGATIGGVGLLGGTGAFGNNGWLYSSGTPWTNPDTGRVSGGGFLNNAWTRAGNMWGSPGRYAGGGRPPVGEPAIVGEAGPELFIPDQPGTVVPLPQPDPRTPAFIADQINAASGGAPGSITARDLMRLQRMLGVTSGRPAMR